MDRIPYRRILILADLAQTLLLGSVPILAAFGLLQMWHLYVIVPLAGTANLFETVTMQSFTPLLVPRDELFAANSTLILSNATVNTTGSALGGLLVTLLGAPRAISVDAISFLVAGLCKARIRHPDGPMIQSLRARVTCGRTFSKGCVRSSPIAFSARCSSRLQWVRSPGSCKPSCWCCSSSGICSYRPAWSVWPSQSVAWPPCWVPRWRPGSRDAWDQVAPLSPGMLLASVAGIVLASAVGPFAVSLAILLLSQVLRGAAPSIYGVNQQTFRQVLIAPALLSRANATWRFLAFWGAVAERPAGWPAGIGARASGDADREQLHHVGRRRSHCVAVTLASHAVRKRGRRREDGGSARVVLLGR